MESFGVFDGTESTARIGKLQRGIRFNNHKCCFI